MCRSFSVKYGKQALFLSLCSHATGEGGEGVGAWGSPQWDYPGPTATTALTRHAAGQYLAHSGQFSAAEGSEGVD